MAQVPAGSNRISSDEFKGLMKKVGRQSYIPSKIQKELKNTGARRFYYESASKNDTIKTLKDLQEKDLISDSRSAEKVYRDMLRQRMAQAPVAKGNLGTGHLPQKLENRLFVRYMGKINPNITPKLKTVLNEYGLVGGRRFLTKEQMKRVLQRLQKEGFALSNVGEDLMEHYLRTRANVMIRIGEEITEEEQRYDAKHHEKLPTGVRRSVGVNAATSASRVNAKDPIHGDTGRTISALGMKKETDEDEDESSTSASIYKKRSGDKNKKKELGDKPDSLPDIFI